MGEAGARPQTGVSPVGFRKKQKSRCPFGGAALIQTNEPTYLRKSVFIVFF